jgi:hypothetical protein
MRLCGCNARGVSRGSSKFSGKMKLVTIFAEDDVKMVVPSADLRGPRLEY